MHSFQLKTAENIDTQWKLNSLKSARGSLSTVDNMYLSWSARMFLNDRIDLMFQKKYHEL
jgi:hypothetical protein